MHKLLLAALPLLSPALLAQGMTEHEWNGTPATATTILSGAQGTGEILGAGDVDYWKFTLASASGIKIWINPGIALLASTSLGDSDLTLFDASGTTQVAFNDNAAADNWLSRITLGSLPPGVYYLRVRSSATAAPAGSGTYTLDVVVGPQGTFGAAHVAEGPEQNDPRMPAGVATAMTVGSRANGLVLPAPFGTPNGTQHDIPQKDYDWFQFTVVDSGPHVFSTLATANLAGQVLADTVLHLFDSSYQLLAFNDNFGGSPYSRLTWTLAPGVYYVSVSSYYGTGALGAYLLDITPPHSLVASPASVTIYGGGCGGATLGTRRVPLPTTSNVRTEVPVLGSTFYVDVTGLDAVAGGVAMMDFVIGPWVNLGTLGGPNGCYALSSPLSMVFFNADIFGRYFWPTSLPAIADFAGLPLVQNAVALDAQLHVIATNYMVSICGG